MDKAYLDTTILTDILLKSGPIKANAEKSLKDFKKTILPQYAIKEFKAGPLQHLVWLHNKLATTQSFSDTIAAIHKLSRTPHRNKTATALEAISHAASNIGTATPKELAEKYGDAAQKDCIDADQYRLEIKRKILSSWKKRRNITTEIDMKLVCYHESAPDIKKNGLIDNTPTRCDKGSECCLKAPLLAAPDSLKSMRETILAQPPKAENTKRAKVLKELIRKGDSYSLDDNQCRCLGDAIITFFAPNDAVILTTNLKDFTPLANALSKKAAAPYE